MLLMVTETSIGAQDVAKRVWFALFAALILWASAFVGIRSTLHDFSPSSLALLRFLIASVVLVLMWLVVKHILRRPITLCSLRDLPLLLLCALLVVVIYNLGLNLGEQTVSAGTASFIVGQQPVVSIILATAILRERVAVLGWVGVWVGAVGTVLLLFADQVGLKLNIGSLYVLAAVVAESLYFVLAKPLLRRYSSLELNVFVTVLGAAMLLPSVGDLARQLSSASTASIWVVVYLGIFPAAIGYLLWNYCIARLSVSTTTSSLYALPVLTIIVSLIFLGELPSLLGLVGGVVSLAGAILVNSRCARVIDQEHHGANRSDLLTG
jgi:drug/metabolite transporter (DMT)-like permease